MLNANGVTVRFGKRVLFEDVNIKFTKRKLLRNNRSKRSRKINIFKSTIRRNRTKQRRRKYRKRSKTISTKTRPLCI